jgi:hypothetical protein
MGIYNIWHYIIGMRINMTPDVNANWLDEEGDEEDFDFSDDVDTLYIQEDNDEDSDNG